MKILLSFDDASVEDTIIADLIIKYGLEKNTTFFFPVMPTVVNENKGRRSLSNEQMQGMSEVFEIGSHTITHQLLTRIPLVQAEVEIKDSRKILQQKFNQPINQFCYPRGYSNPETQRLVVDAGYTSARSTLVGYIHKDENQFFQQTTVHAGCNRKEYGGKSWLDYAKYMLNLARNTPNSIYSVWGHGYEIFNNGALGDFELLLQELSNEKTHAV